MGRRRRRRRERTRKTKVRSRAKCGTDGGASTVRTEPMCIAVMLKRKTARFRMEDLVEGHSPSRKPLTTSSSLRRPRQFRSME